MESLLNLKMRNNNFCYSRYFKNGYNSSIYTNVFCNNDVSFFNLKF